MSQPRPPQPAKLVIGMLLNDKSLLAVLSEELESAFGNIDMISSWMAFGFTTYYAKEMGEPLWRRMLVFKGLIEQASLAKVKQVTNALETRFTQDGKRCVNIDPGYLLNERFVLATGKNFAHRIYIGLDIYADLTLIFQRGAFQTLPWTYPDYADDTMTSFLKQVRHKYAADLRAHNASGGSPLAQ